MKKNHFNSQKQTALFLLIKKFTKKNKNIIHFYLNNVKKTFIEKNENYFIHILTLQIVLYNKQHSIEKNIHLPSTYRSKNKQNNCTIVQISPTEYKNTNESRYYIPKLAKTPSPPAASGIIYIFLLLISQKIQMCIRVTHVYTIILEYFPQIHM